jgi:hypothetical protein
VSQAGSTAGEKSQLLIKKAVNEAGLLAAGIGIRRYITRQRICRVNLIQGLLDPCREVSRRIRVITFHGSRAEGVHVLDCNRQEGWGGCALTVAGRVKPDSAWQSCGWTSFDVRA